MTVDWSLSQDKYPDSVQALMAVWGGFDAPRGSGDCGLEKRLELDFRGVVVPTAIMAEDVAAVMSHAGEALVRHSVRKEIVTFEFTKSVAVLTDNRIVVTAASSVLLHAVLHPLLRLFGKHAIQVEWASFMRMNTASPWTATCEMSDIMAQEYADLKSAFPSGHPYLTGPVDRDHFFYFVYDAIDRNRPDARSEEDVQINIYMYNVRTDDDGIEPVKNMQKVVPLSEGEYRTLRVATEGAAYPFASFETNAAADALSTTAVVTGLVEKYSPDRFTMVVLQDRNSHLGRLRPVFDDVDGYAIMNRAVNHFGEGYAFHQAVYTRTE
ncbi:S-adenosylmethionine decarboxylase proenzyme [Trypanosoma grayi]|uniref:S-adenosylmethionine decarboxylase proenzyme n=1 Tax=Trypanosoma grayi TaxID=71804 RepID=UPI0004F47F26|nr:S-adenosylmethionine decarboxylase proenzyme [Trypanosoma grayi]KEG14434.1 S-adenosylmethionine decarboxylase proenzyme [Trypanosoma grayi]